tara:strand:+ start:178 stop:528 length:351 start_codon:yes stop_codon:yes gene_type:complete
MILREDDCVENVFHSLKIFSNIYCLSSYPVSLSIIVVEKLTSGSNSNANTTFEANANTGTPPERAFTTGSSLVLTISKMIRITKKIREVAIFDPLLLFLVNIIKRNRSMKKHTSLI